MLKTLSQKPEKLIYTVFSVGWVSRESGTGNGPHYRKSQALVAGSGEKNKKMCPKPELSIMNS